MVHFRPPRAVITTCPLPLPPLPSFLQRPRSRSIGEEGYYKDEDGGMDERPKGTWHVDDNGEADDDDDDMSLVSRSPSPAPPGDVDMEDVYKYDEHVRGYAREVVSVETRIKSTNKGFGLLAKMGWIEGQPLGLSGDGAQHPFYLLRVSENVPAQLTLLVAGVVQVAWTPSRSRSRMT